MSLSAGARAVWEVLQVLLTLATQCHREVHRIHLLQPLLGFCAIHEHCPCDCLHRTSLLGFRSLLARLAFHVMHLLQRMSRLSHHMF